MDGHIVKGNLKKYIVKIEIAHICFFYFLLLKLHNEKRNFCVWSSVITPEMVHNSLCVIFMILVSLENFKKMCFFYKFFLTLLVSSGLLHLKKKFPKNHSHKNENKIVKLRDSATLCVQEEPDFYRENLAKDQFRFSGWQLWNKERYFLAFIWPISQAPFWQEKLTKMYPIKRQLQQGTLHIRNVHLICSGGAGHSHEFFFKN